MKMKSSLLCAATLLALGTLATSCKKDSTPSNPTGKKIKITVRVTGFNDNEGDFVSVSLAGGNSTNNSTVWKVNGTTRPNENGIGLGKNELAGGTTYVIETINPIDMAIVGYQFINFDSPMNIYFKAEVNGTVVNEDQLTLADDQNATKRYQY